MNNTRPSNKNIHPARIEEFDPTIDITTQLNQLRQHVEDRAVEAINWYLKRKASKSFWSRGLRFLAILFTTLGGLIPVSTPLLPYDFMGQLGYVMLALAAACIGFDHFFGLSTGWMRFMVTEMSLQQVLAEFQMDWQLLWAKVEDGKPTAEQQQMLLQRLKTFRLQIIKEMTQEMQAWVAEFQSNLALLEKTTRERIAEQHPGSIELIVADADQAEQGVRVSIDGLYATQMRGTQTTQIGPLIPGQHIIAVQGVVKGKTCENASVINVPPGGVVTLRLNLSGGG